MCDHHRRVSAAQLKIGEEAIKVRLKGMRYRLYTRVCASIGVYSSGNEVNLALKLEVATRLTIGRFVWERERDRSTIGLVGLRSIRLSSKSRVICMRKW